MRDVYFSMPARVCFQRKGLDLFLPEARRYGKKILLVTGKNFIFTSGLFERITRLLLENGMEYAVYTDVNPEPSIEDVEAGTDACLKEGCDCVLAVGGGSAIDAGKAIAVMAANSGTVRDYFGEVDYKNNPLPLVAVPTTCGTGSEVTKFAVIVDKQAHTKKTLNSEKIIPKLSILDPELLTTLPNKLVVATGMDAFAHSAESFLSNKADYISSILAKESLRILWEFLPRARRYPESIDIKEKIFLASLMAGLALNKTGTIILHGMAYSLTVEYGMHHGTANALLLPYVFGYLKDNGYREEMKELETIWGETSGLKNFIASLGLPSKLSQAGVGQSEIEKLAEFSIAGTERSLKNMKSPLGKVEFTEILEKAF